MDQINKAGEFTKQSLQEEIEKQKFNSDTAFIVSLDMERVLSGENGKQTLAVAEAVLNICGSFKIWDNPRNGHRVFYTRVMPEDIPQAGIYWIKEELPIRPYETLFPEGDS